jgi:hypothetical protein
MDPNPLIHLSRFDLASRGPWGAIRLMLSLRGQHIACLGAAITILAMGSGPFIQQVLKFNPCLEVVAGLQASTLRTNNYTTDGIHTGAALSSLDPPMQAAIYEGAYNSFSAVVPTCPTGNCTLTPYRTVGMCSECNDISDTINTACSTDTVTPCIWTSPSGLSLNSSIIGDVVMRMSTVALAASEIIAFTELLDYDRKNLTAIESVGLSDLPSDVMALTCSLFPCVRTYNIEVVQNQNNEVLLDTFEMIQQSDWDLSAIETTEQTSPLITTPYFGAPMPCLLDGVYYDATSFTERNITNTWPVAGLLPNNETAYLPSSCVFEYESTLGLRGFLPTLLTGFVASTREVSYADPDWMMQLWNSGNATFMTVNATWAAIADSMTMRIRRSGDPSNSAPALGIVLQTETCVSVQWPWLIFPAALLLLTLVFLLATMAQSRKYTNRHIWKGSPLALLFHGMDQDLSDRYRLVDRLYDMEESASHMVVQIKHTEGGLRFVDAARR